MEDKIIVTHRGALTGKYQAKGLAKIRAGLADLVAADKKRGFKTAIVYLDDARTMKRLGAKALEDAADRPSAKAAIDKVYKALKPDYLLILGAPDVVPQQDLKNPAYSPPDDDDQPAWGDLPYACDAPYSRDTAHFVGPTRVVGRLPDLMSAEEPSYLLSLLKTAANWTSRQAGDYAPYFGLSTDEWKGSTRLSLNNIFGNTDSLLLAPRSGPKYPSGQLRARMHFINCHGGSAAPEFYGQQGNKYPKSLTTAATARTISEGTVAAIECCYGGQLYDSNTLGIDMPICQSYLLQGTYGYFGSTTIAYGPAKENGAADLICQYFLLNVLDGASIGRAALMARQQFVEHNSQMDPVDLKTLAQFCLYGDPSVHPVTQPVSPGLPKGVAADHAERFLRSERREKLKLNGDFLQKTKPTASKRRSTGRISTTTKTALSNIAKRGGLSQDQKFVAFGVKGAKMPKAGPAKAATAPSRYYVAVGTPKGKAYGRGIAVVAKEVGGRIIDYRIYHQH
ncbi:MAG TPA: hypothetical protein VK479_14760 [Micropepsaceae bacterium]|nr:hypothetical protein [Micropepsaceae bacterium]